VFRAARAALRFFRRDPAQIELPFRQGPASLRARLVSAGLEPEWKVAVTHNRTTMVSFRGRSLRVHRAYVDAPDDVIRAIVRFVTSRRRRVRREASRVILEYAPRNRATDVSPLRHRDRPHPEDERFVRRLVDAHDAYNRQFFGGVLRAVPIRVSRRMRRKLGHYSPATDGLPPEIAISRQHIRRESWEDVLHTLLHEMVHQWQDEQGFPLAHDQRFREMAKAVGADPRAVRKEGVVYAARVASGPSAVSRRSASATASRGARSRSRRSTA
jgi:hypothetical protein